MEELNNIEKSDQKKGKMNKERFEKKSHLKRVERRPEITFDAYFVLLLSSDNNIFPHHKAPMRLFAKKEGMETATKEDFDILFEKY